MTEPHSALRVDAITKAYGATVALNGASFAVRAGEVHALLGENGAGKSTMVKLLSGLVQPDAGTITLGDEPVRLRQPVDAHRHGIQTAFQEMTLVRDLTVTANMLLPKAPVLLGQLRRRQGERMVAEHLARLGLDSIDPRAEIRDLELPVRQKIEIARAVFRRPRILLLDEPTSTLSGRDIDWLGGLIERVRADGVTVVFISHRLPEVRRFCDRLTVLRNGKDIGTAEVDAIGDDEVIRMIIGRSLAATFPPRPVQRSLAAGEAPVLEARGLATDGKLAGAGFALRRGEILGVAGLQGMGQQELFLACFGMTALRQGEIRVDGRHVTLASPRDAVRANIGISLVPEDRKTEGLFLRLDGKSNISLPVIDRFARWGLIDGAAETAAVARHPGCGRSPAACALHPGRRIQRRQPAEDRDRQVAARRQPHPAHVRPDARRRYRDQAPALSADAPLRRCGRLDPVPLDRDRRAGESLRPGAGPVCRPRRPGTRGRRDRRRKPSCAPPWARPRACRAWRRERRRTGVARPPPKAAGARAPSRAARRLRRVRGPVRPGRCDHAGSVQLFRAELHVVGRGHAGTGRDGPDHRHPHRRLRSLGRGRGLAGQRRARHLDGAGRDRARSCSASWHWASAGWSGWSTASSWRSSGCSRSSSRCRPCSSSRASRC